MDYAIVSTRYLPLMGGVESFCAGLAEALDAEGHRVTLITSAVHGLPARERLFTHGEIYRLPCHPLLGARLPVPRKNAAYRALVGELAAKPFDGLLINTRFYPLSLEMARLAREQGLQPVVLDHGSAYLTFGTALLDGSVKLWEHGITKRLQRYDPAFYGISAKSSEWLATFGISSLGEIPNAIDADGFAASAAPIDFRALTGCDAATFLVAFVGRLVPEKGLPIVLEAAAALQDEGFAFVIAGSGALEREVLACPASNVHYAGQLARPEVAALLKAADGLALPSRSEGFCTTLLEAAATATAPITTDVGGAREVLGDSLADCLLPANPTGHDLANRLRFLKNHPDKAAAIAEAVGERVRRDYTWSSTAHRVIEAFEHAAQSPSSTRA